MRYGSHPEQVADLWMPGPVRRPRPGVGPPYPVVVSIHGGYFQRQYRRDLHDPLCRHLVAAGLAVLNVEYRRSRTDGSLERTTDDVMSAISWLGSRSAHWRPGVSVVGHSAGGYLALWAASHPSVDLAVGLAAVSDLVDCVNGGYDGGAVATWLGSRPKDDPARYAQADLLRRLPTGTATWLVHGDNDLTVPLHQSTRYVERARQEGDASTLSVLAGGDHFAVIDPGSVAFASWYDRLVERVLG